MGRTSLLLVIGFNLTFMLMGFRLSAVTSASYEKYCSYADIEQAGLILESAANIAISNALLTPSPSADTTLCTNDSLARGTYTIRRLLKFTNGTRDGDSLVITGIYPFYGSTTGIVCTTTVRVRGNAFSQYVFYSESESYGGNKIYWMNGEVCRGRLHTQDNLYIQGNPDFKGKVTTKGNVTITSGTPNFEQGHTKADIAIPTKLDDFTTLGTNGGLYSRYNNVDTYIQFLPTGKIVVRAEPVGTASSGSTCWNETKTTAIPSTSPAVKYYQVFNTIADLTSTGVFLVQDGALHIKGVLDGQITVGAVDVTSGSGKSSVWLDSSVVYKDAPPCSQFPSRSSNDMLGIIATNNIMISDVANNNNSTNGITINASMFCQKGGFGAENYDDRRNRGSTGQKLSSGVLHLVGGVQQHQRMPVGQSPSGFTKDYDFDNNLLTQCPKGYPKTPFVVDSWVDNTTIPDNFWR
jgi:cytoskeletal protein CcmA (bactofilin family)